MNHRLLACLLLLPMLAACNPPPGPDTAAPAADKAAVADTEAGGDDCLTEPPPEPVMCTADWRPVCGCDGKTYSNACNARAAGVTRYEEGECGGAERR